MVKKLLWSVVGVSSFVAIGVSVFVVLWDRDVEAEMIPAASVIPLDWQQQIRRLSNTLPDLSSFVPDSVTEGNAAELVYSLSGSEGLSRLAVLYDSIGVAASPIDVDLMTVAAINSDATVNGLVAASKMNSFNSTEHIKAISGGTNARWLVAPDPGPLHSAVRALLVRAELHSLAAEHAEAREDIAAVLRLGDLMFRQSAVLAENIAGSRIIGQGAGQLFRYAVAVPDTAAFEISQALQAWAASVPRYDPLVLALGSDMERALEIVRDTDVLPAWRGLAVEKMVSMQYRPKNIFMGIPASVRANVSNLRSISDPRVAWSAEVAENSIDWFNSMGVMDRVGFLRGAFLGD